MCRVRGRKHGQWPCVLRQGEDTGGRPPGEVTRARAPRQPRTEPRRATSRPSGRVGAGTFRADEGPLRVTAAPRPPWASVCPVGGSSRVDLLPSGRRLPPKCPRVPGPWGVPRAPRSRLSLRGLRPHASACQAGVGPAGPVRSTLRPRRVPQDSSWCRDLAGPARGFGSSLLECPLRVRRRGDAGRGSAWPAPRWREAATCFPFTLPNALTLRAFGTCCFLVT